MVIVVVVIMVVIVMVMVMMIGVYRYDDLSLGRNWCNAAEKRSERNKLFILVSMKALLCMLSARTQFSDNSER